jgi:hypothetical protein
MSKIKNMAELYERHQRRMKANDNPIASIGTKTVFKRQLSSNGMREVFIILEQEHCYQAMRVVADDAGIEDERSKLEASNLYISVTLTERVK